jgi:DNA polymerase
MKHLTELDNPNSVQQMKQWLADNGMETDTLGKKIVVELLKTAPPDLADVLSLRQQLAKSSVRKYQAMENAVCADGRARGMFQFFGANRTGRWAGRLIQMQNLPQNHLEDLAEARALVRFGDFDALEMLYEDVPDTLSQLIRTAFVPRAGARFIVSDFSAIEARVIAWLAGEQWRQDVFAKGGDIYCASASQMFKVPVEKHGINGHLRQKGKIAELALGYGGSVGALKAMGALDMGLEEDELPPLVDAWRQANPHIVKFWWDVDKAAMEAVRYKRTNSTHGITFSCQSGMLFITLPSGRRLAYVKPRIGENKFGGQCITYEGVGATKKWERLDSYGPKFVENIVQATARDILCSALQTLRNCSIVMHVHDEIVIEADPGISLKTVCEQMGRTPSWAKGLLLRADGYETDFYKKD